MEALWKRSARPAGPIACAPVAARTDDQLRELSGHVLWHVTQLCRLGAHLKVLRDLGPPIVHRPLDAAALEAFLVHARALAEFVWKSRSDKPKPRDTDGFAEDYFDTDRWRPVDKPQPLDDDIARIGRGLVHVSYRRLDPAEAWGWDLDWLGAALYIGLIDFATRVPQQRVDARFNESLRHEFLDELRVDPIHAHIGARALGHSVGTPILASWLPPAPQ